MVGSLTGNLRVFFPSQRDYRVEDLIIEKNLQEPILQIDAGRFLP